MKSVPIIAAAGALALTLAACGSGQGSGGTSGGQDFVNGKTFTLVLGADPGNLDPHFTSLSGTHQVDRFLYDSLINVDENGKVVAGLADKWEATTSTANFTLRKGVTCADGTPLTATTVAANITFVGDPKNASSRIGVFVPPGATAIGDDAAGTVTVTSATPSAFLDREVGQLQIVCPKGMADRGLLKQGAVGTGMYALTEAVPSDHYTLTRRKDYTWGAGDWKADQQGLPDTVVLKVVANETTAANLLISGQVNAVALSGPDKQRLKAQKLFERTVASPFGELWFNQKPGLPGADEPVRRALTQALDLGQLGQVVTSGEGKPSTSLVVPALGPCKEDTITANLPKHDPAAAKTALDAAGWTAGPDGRAKDGKKLSLSFFYPTGIGSTMRAAAELVQKVWTELGVEVTLKGVTDAEAGQLIVGGQGTWDATLVPLNVTLPSQLVPFFSGATPPDGTNFAFIQNAEYTAAAEAAAAIPGPDGCGKWAEAETALVRQVDIVPFVDSPRPTFASGATFELSQGSVTPGSIRMLG